MALYSKRYASYGKRPMHSGELMQELGLRAGGHLPAEGMPAREINGVTVYVLPANGPDTTSRRNKSSKHRVMAICPDCQRHMSAGRLTSQHYKHCKGRKG